MSGKFGEGLIYASRTDRGLCRDINQDAITVFVKGGTGLFVLSDGMGGHSRGELASYAVTARFQDFWQTLTHNDSLPEFQVLSGQVQDVIVSANREIYKKYNQGRICGATVAVLLISDGCYGLFSVGDSRIYSYSAGGVRRLTVDDTWDTLPSVADRYTQEEIAASENSGKLTQAVGVKPQICIHTVADRIGQEGTFLVCSDGFYKYCDEKQIGKCLRRVRTEKALQTAAEHLMGEVFDNGAGDNVSFILVKAK